MESKEKDSLSGHNASWTGACEANLHPLKSNPELSIGKSPVFSQQSEKGIVYDHESCTRLGEAAAGMIRRAEDFLRRKDLLYLILSYPLPDSATYHEDLRFPIRRIPKMSQAITRLVDFNWNILLHDKEFANQKNKNKYKIGHKLCEIFLHKCRDKFKLIEEMEGNIQNGESLLPKVDFDLVAYIPRAYFVSSHNRRWVEVGPMHETSAACEAPDEMLTLAVNSAIRQVSAYVKKRSSIKIGISGSGGEKVARAVMDIERMRQDCSNVAFHISVRMADSKATVRNKIAEQVDVLLPKHQYFSLDLNELLPHEYFLYLECVDGWANLRYLRLLDHGVIVLTARSQEVYKAMDVDVEVRMEDHLLPWDLFCENVGQSLVDSSSALKQMAIQLVKECHCQLHAIILLARALKDVTDISVWELALHKLSSHSSAMEEGSSQVMKRVLGVVWDQKDLKTKYCIQHCTSRWKEGLVEGSPVSEWISSNFVQTEAEGKGIFEDLISSFLLENDDRGVFMRTETKVVLDEYFTSCLPSIYIRQGGLGLIKTPTVGEYTKEIELHDNKLSELPENPKCLALRKLRLQNNCDLMEIPQLFFEDMPLLVYLDLSHTSIKSLPPSISRLVSLETFYLRGCKVLKKLPPHIGALHKLEDFDLEGTEVIYLPREIGKLISLRCFKVSLCGHANYCRETKQTGSAIPTEVLSIFCQLEELSIDVSPDGEWWDDDVNPASDWWDADVKAILNALNSSNKLRILELYLPSVELLQQLKFPNLSNFRLIVGRHQQRIICRLPNGVEKRFKTWVKKYKKSLQYINGEGRPSGITEALKHASLLFVDRHWTIKVLSEFGHEILDNLQCCLLVECNELQTIVGGDYECPFGDDEKPILPLLCHLSIHYMKNLESIWQGSIPNESLFNLRSLTLHTCPSLTTIFTLDMLVNLRCLEELIVEDCPKIRSIVTQEHAHVESDRFLEHLRKIALLDLPQLVTISGPLCLGKKVDILFVYNCPMLKSLCNTKISPNYYKIVAEKEWWESLKWHNSKWRRMTQPAYEELRTVEDVMDHLAKDIYSDQLCAMKKYPDSESSDELADEDSRDELAEDL
ncbi:hypothetical protein RHMOL_Rhmol11G0182700 [Rhododendron molle]|uniref:Uncharacterized protein n=1 Tax=Rhododendron molle TaxID=49168 RepID=A0ACC0LUN8_RHOML|nr:hypothetical protein RHMOL_Rhmol11G0182700 [Rhododendron molle]